jgi:peptidoglycan/LPS O-acetylase OafA/YrhL
MVGYSAVALLAGVALVTAVSAPSTSFSGRAWAHPALRFCGRYSYGMYVWHVAVIQTLRATFFTDAQMPVLAGSRLPGDALFLAVAGIFTVGVALASWHLLEKPFHQLKRFVPYDRPARSIRLADNDPYPVASAANL